MSALYYPNLTVEYSTTTTGMIVANYPMLYAKPVTERTIVHVDMTLSIPNIIKEVTHKEMAKEEFALTQGLFKLLLAGNVDNDTYRRAVENLCVQSPTFQYYLLYVTEFGEKALPVIAKILQPIRERLDFYTKEYQCLLNSFPKSKFCMRTNDQLYYSIAWRARLKDFPIPVEYIEV